jgi:hypothetical protein
MFLIILLSLIAAPVQAVDISTGTVTVSSSTADDFEMGITTRTRPATLDDLERFDPRDEKGNKRILTPAEIRKLLKGLKLRDTGKKNDKRF